MIKYKLVDESTVEDQEHKGRFLPVNHPKYKKWIAEGNVPEPVFTPEELVENEAAQAKREKRQRVLDALLDGDYNTVGDMISSIIAARQ